VSVTEDRKSAGEQQRVAVKTVDCDVHPVWRDDEEIARYIPERWRSVLSRTGHERPTGFSYYDPPDFLNAAAMRYDAKPPAGGRPGSDPDFAFEQLVRGAGVDIGILQPIPSLERLPEADHARRMAVNEWLADIWLDKNNQHGRWRGSILASVLDPHAGAREIERWADHPSMVQVLIYPQTSVSFGDPTFDPIYEAASRHGLPVATHLMGLGPYERTPISPVGNPSHWHDFMAAWPLLFVSHVTSLVFDGTFERFPELQVVFVEGAFTWLLPLMWRMDAYWSARRRDLPQVKRKPSEYVRDHIWMTTQPMEDPEDFSDYRRYLEWMDPVSLLMFSTDYPHWSYDAPGWTLKRIPEAARQRVMAGNAIDLYRLPQAVDPLPN
jgi:uncharacterized protein